MLVTDQKHFKKGRGLEQIKSACSGEGLLTSEGEFHLRQRRLIQPAFHRQRVAAYAEAMTHYANQMAWALAGRRDTLDIHEEMMRLTLAVVGKTLFGAEVEAEASEIDGALGRGHRAVPPAATPLFRIFWNVCPSPPSAGSRSARARLDSTIYRLIAEHRATGVKTGAICSRCCLRRGTKTTANA